ncbi:MAG: HAMP domain-containing protein, partial [Chloroflexi bacterium]
KAGRLTAALAVPIVRQGRVSGALGVEFALDRLQRNIADTVMREHAVVLLLDNSGRVLVAPEARYYASDVPWMNVPIVQHALRGEQGTDEYVNPIDQRTWLGAFAPVRRAGWAVLVSYPSDEVFAPVHSATLMAGLSLGTVLLIALGVAYWMALRFTRPLQRVKDTALAIAAGDYAERVPQAQLPHDEVGQLAIAFNQMAEALQQHMRRLMDAQAEIEQKARDLQGLLDRSVRVQEDERRRIAQDIHDGVTQMLVGSIYEMQAAKQALGNGAGANHASVQKLNEALALASDSVSEIRRVIFDLHPTILDELGLVAALQRLVMRNDSDTLHCTLHVEGAPARLPAAHELAFYRIAQEALNNARRHAMAKNARVQLRFQRDATLLVVNDDGRGIETPARQDASAGQAQPAAEHLGLKGMRERAQSVGGQCEVVSGPGTGTRISVTIPKSDERRMIHDGN